MNNKFKNLIYPICAVGVSLLFLILSLLPHYSISSINFDGYMIMIMKAFNGMTFTIFISTFFQFLHIVTLILLLNIGVFGILVKTGVVEVKKSLKNWTYEKLLKVLFTIMGSLGLVLIISMLITCATNDGYFTIGFGVILNGALEIIACVAFWLLDYYGILNGTYIPKEKKQKVSKANSEEMPEDEAEVLEENNDEKIQDEAEDDDKQK